MRRNFERTMQVLLWGVGVTIVWAALALTGWGGRRSPLGAGPGYLDAIAPLTYVAGALLVSISATLLIQAAAAAWKQRGEAHETPPAVPRITPGRTWGDLPAHPPVANGGPAERER